MNRILRITALFAALIICPAIHAAPKNAKPFVIPELREWRGGEGNFTPEGTTRIVYPAGDAQLEAIAGMLASDWAKMFGTQPQTAAGKPQRGDIFIARSRDKKLGDEGYAMNITEKQITISAPTATGIYWGTRTVLQIAEQSADHAFPCGTVRDWPDYPVRGFMLDCARKFIPLQYLRDYAEIMSYYKMNAFHVHLNDNGFSRFFDNDWKKTYSAFRLESDLFPELTAHDGHYTKEEFRQLQQMARERFVEIIPEIDIPAHSMAFAHFRPDLGSDEYGKDHLDLFKQGTYDFLDSLLTEYIAGPDPVFTGPRIHIGTDEYSNRKKEVVEKFRYFTDYYIRFVEKLGKQACIWGALTHARGETPVKADSVVMWAWHNPYAQPDSMMKLGYKLVSIPDGLMYIVPKAGYYYDYLNIRKLYDSWTPATIGGKKFDEHHPQILGGMFALWNDHVGNGVSSKDIHDRLMPAIQTIAAKTWSSSCSALPFDEFDAGRRMLSEAPGINIAGKVGEPGQTGPVYTTGQLKPGTATGIREIGYDYTVSFDIEGTKEDRGTLLFSSPEAEFYLSDPVSGLIGFSRDGYLYTWPYSIRKGEKARIVITGDSRDTQLYVNGRQIHDQTMRHPWDVNKQRQMNISRTLVFPLEKAGGFKSRITDFKVFNRVEKQ